MSWDQSKVFVNVTRAAIKQSPEHTEQSLLIRDFETNGTPPQSDALAAFGITGDLARKVIFPALWALARRGVLNAPVVGVAAPTWSLSQPRIHAADSPGS
ncbi:MAG TPA: hypothetical protein VMV68_07715 [Spirochaetia bacterium]|nr:hypothetical protein [Spirochaetia bacterium]